MYKGELLLPILRHLSGEKFGGDFRQTADYRDTFAGLIAKKGVTHDMAADPLFLPDDQPSIAGARAIAADLDAERSAMSSRVVRE